MKLVDVVVLVYAIVLIVFGILGFVEAQSAMSLIGGAGFGALLLGTLALAKTKPRVARISAAVISLLPLGRFLPSFLKEHKWYPAGIVVVLGIVTFLVLVGGHFVAMSKRKSEAQ